MLRYIVFIVIKICICTTLIDCNNHSTKGTSSKIEQVDSTINIKGGDKFEITLESPPGMGFGTGKSWQLLDSSFTSFLRLSKQTYKTNNSIPGGSDTQIFFFTAIQKGVVKITFIYSFPRRMRDFSKDDITKTYKIIIR